MFRVKVGVRVSARVRVRVRVEVRVTTPPRGPWAPWEIFCLF